MLTLELLTAGALMAALTFYALLGGADFGAGVWDLWAAGPRKKDQRRLISEALGPIWEANHVWLILAIVITFNAFPPVFAAISTALFIPLTIMLVGIVLRGAAFVFRSYGGQADEVQHLWGRLFAIASIITPLMLGLCIGAISSGTIVMQNGIVTSSFFTGWLAPFPLAVSALTLALFAFLAAVYLTVEAKDSGLREGFRLRALLSAIAVGLLAFLVLGLAHDGAPRIWAGLVTAPWAVPLQIITGLVALGAIGLLWTRRYYLARAFVGAQVVLILWGWAIAQFPNLVSPDLTIQNAAAPTATLALLLTLLGLGALLLFPSFYFLYRLFKGEHVFKVLESGPTEIEQATPKDKSP
jgi:cytochrome bd ubiquinol oxidase subunit II